MLLIYALIGLLSIGGMIKIAENFSKSFLVDKSDIQNWTKKYYGVNLNNHICSICKNKINSDNLSRIFSINKKIYIVCKKKGCHMLTNKEIMEIGNHRINY